MTKRLAIALLAVLIAQVIRTALANPPPVIARLMRERVNMLDRGLDHIQNDLLDALNDEPTRSNAGLPETPGVSADYDRPTDRIIVWLFYGYEIHDADVVCRKTIAFLRKRLDPRWPNGKRRADAHIWLIYFMHAGVGKPEHTPAWRSLEVIPSLITFRVMIPSTPTDVNCSGPLIGDSVTFEK